MYAAKLAADAAAAAVKAKLKLSPFALQSSPDGPASTSSAGEKEQTTAGADFSAEKLMAWLDDPANKARMYVRHARHISAELLNAGRR